MGNSDSGQNRTNDTAGFDAETASDEVLQCEDCRSDSEQVFSCKQCQKNLCSACCKPHSDTQHAEVKQQVTKNTEQHRPVEVENRFYHSILHMKEADSLSINSSKAYKKKIRCGTVAQNGNLALFSKLSYQDKFCNCCINTFKWKLCFLKDKPLYITKRQHKVNDTHIFPGDMCYVEIKRELYLTLPCKRMVYRRPVGEYFYEAFGTPLGSCFGIAELKEGLALSIEIPTNFKIAKWQIQFVDFTGKVRRRIQYDSRGGALFKEPLYLTSNKDRTILFVSDHGKSSVMAFETNDGRLLFNYHGIALVSPLGIAADMYNNVYVACGKTVLQIEAGGGRSKKLLDGKDKIVSTCMDYDTNTLFSISECGKVSSFEFEYIGE